MKRILIFLFTSSVAAYAATEEQVNRRFNVQPGGSLIVDVDFGSINISTNGSNEVTVDVFRKIGRKTEADESQYLLQHPVTFDQSGSTITVRSRAPGKISWGGFRQKTEGRYTITLPAHFNAQVKTSGGSVSVAGVTGDVKAVSSGGGLKFMQLHGRLDGDTSGGGVRVTECHGPQKVHTSGGGIEISGGAGSLDGDTSGGSVSVKDFRGPVGVKTSGGGITVENVSGKVTGSTSGGSISARLASPVTEEIDLRTSGGGVAVHVASDSAFDLDAATSGGSVFCELPVVVVGKARHDHLKGPVQGGGKQVVLRSSGGSIRVRKY